MKSRRAILGLTLLGSLLLAAAFHERLGLAWGMAKSRMGKRTVTDRLTEFGSAARARLAGDFAKAGVSYPPARATLLALKDERRLEIYAANAGALKFIRSYPVLAASGGPGPKLKEGDRQVPEGIYEIELLNPNSAYHVSLRLNYPNAFDRAQAAKDGRTQLGGDIMIHGKAASIGCLAMGDPAAEEIFTLAADVGIKNVKVISCPVDFRESKSSPRESQPTPWVMELYQDLATQLVALPLPPR